jgi:hypothetical protein
MSVRRRRHGGEGLAQAGVIVGPEVRVRLEGRLHVRVSERASDSHGTAPAGDQGRSETVTQIVEPRARQTCP